ncbi:hypothetical protein CAPTEDRAFT_214973 [Capitella teleta]|uniref:Uncharacterized protein n=1 Tax=Capitella teleta TaxID=283909 RepID=R7T763_CAPTE|nr:hypothetical protein CAPTEDRAFT_214973 [Capitella teleta]|eukprot:ELT89425.1 hypothetical protein CAPTEDRAFT_214973 [Capitella teleta]
MTCSSKLKRQEKREHPRTINMHLGLQVYLWVLAVLSLHLEIIYSSEIHGFLLRKGSYSARERKNLEETVNAAKPSLALISLKDEVKRTMTLEKHRHESSASHTAAAATDNG